MHKRAKTAGGYGFVTKGKKSNWTQFAGDIPENTSLSRAKKGVTFNHCYVLGINYFAKPQGGSPKPCLSVPANATASFLLLVDATNITLTDDPTVTMSSPSTIEFSPINFEPKKPVTPELTEYCKNLKPLKRTIKDCEIIEIRTSFHKQPISVLDIVRVAGFSYYAQVAPAVSNGVTFNKESLYTNCSGIDNITESIGKHGSITDAPLDTIQLMHKLICNARRPLITPWSPVDEFENEYRSFVVPFYITPIEHVNTNIPFMAITDCGYAEKEMGEPSFNLSFKTKESKEKVKYNMLNLESKGLLYLPNEQLTEAGWIVEKGKKMDFSVIFNVGTEIIGQLGPRDLEIQKEFVKTFLKYFNIIYVVRQKTSDTNSMSFNNDENHADELFALAGSATFAYSDLVPTIRRIGIPITRDFALELLNGHSNPKKIPPWTCSIPHQKALAEATRDSPFRIDRTAFQYLNEEQPLPEAIQPFQYMMLVDPLSYDTLVSYLEKLKLPLVQIEKIVKEEQEEGEEPNIEDDLIRFSSTYEPIQLMKSVPRPPKRKLVREDEPEEGEEAEDDDEEPKSAFITQPAPLGENPPPAYINELRRVLFNTNEIRNTHIHLYALTTKETPLMSTVTDALSSEEFKAQQEKMYANYLNFKNKTGELTAAGNETINNFLHEIAENKVVPTSNTL